MTLVRPTIIFRGQEKRTNKEEREYTEIRVNFFPNYINGAMKQS